MSRRELPRRPISHRAPRSERKLATPTRSRAWERRFAPLGPFDGENRRRGGGRLVVAANRLPVALEAGQEGAWALRPSAGGLVTALDPVLRRRGGIWTGWAGAPDVGREELTPVLAEQGWRSPYRLEPIALTPAEEALFYRGFSNQALWPALHGFVEHCEPRDEDWKSYRRVNRRFARALAHEARWDDLLWVHDYHLILAGLELRDLEVEARLAFFLHTPFPGLQALERIPWHRELVRGLLAYDLVGFQTPTDRENFLSVARSLVPAAFPDDSPSSDPVVDGRVVRTGAFPISIDSEAFSAASFGPVVAAMAREIRAQEGARTLLVGVDRLDYSKGIPEKLEGFRLALRRHRELHGGVVLHQLVVPSRDEIPAYARTRARIESLVQAINEEWARDGWTPVRYEYGSWSRSELLARYRAADVALVTPLVDGMNLVAKEYVVASDDSGVLILSSFAGAAGELSGNALLVDPRDPDALARAILHAHRMPPRERRERLARARKLVRAHDVHRWARGFLTESLRAG